MANIADDVKVLVTEQRLPTVKEYVVLLVKLSLLDMGFLIVGSLTDFGPMIWLGIIAGVLCSIGWYVLPGAVAVVMDHHNKVAITVTNVLLGWTVIGWVVSLIWATTKR